MFQMFGFGGAGCPRCAHQNADAAGYCAACGMTLGAPRNAPALSDNRWIPGPNELAVFFGVRALSGLFGKTLHVPATTRAFVLQGDKASEVPRGDYEIEGFFASLGNLRRDQRGEILVTRSTPMAVEFAFEALHSAEHLAVDARFSVGIAIDDVPLFARHFMTMPGTVTDVHLRELIAPSVRQLATEFVAAQSLRDMAGNANLRAELDERLHGGLKLRLAQFGLAVARVDTLALRHDKFDANRKSVGTLWLAVDGGHVALEHAKQLDVLYNEQEWQAIWRQEQETRQQLRREELRHDASGERAELRLASAERLQAVRLREIDLYGRIAAADSRKQALARGAGELLAELEHALAEKNAVRGDEAGEWTHLRALAQVKMRSALEIEQQAALEARQLAQQRFAHQLLQQQIENKITQALGIEDEARKRAQLQLLHQSREAAARNLLALEQERHRAAWQALSLANGARQRGAERVQEWEDQVALARQRDLVRAGGKADALGQHEKLLRTIEADSALARQRQQVALEGEQQRNAMRIEAQEARWQQELRRLEHERGERFAQLAHAAELARLELARMERLGAMSDTAKLALAAAPNAAQLADYLKAGIHAGMSAEQLAALSGVVAAANGVTPAAAALMAEQRALREGARRDAELDKDRRHQRELMALQNDVNKAALAAQAQLGMGVAQGAAPACAQQAPARLCAGHAAGAAERFCANGHAAGAADRFCARCGAALA
ncbi:hypothetical protein [Massilia glaciei]|uniref:Band 7 domain-containing protein n=1 Tax=Massilia glaciei TaxID=1524097 RepID=A0A2U2HMU6_9BURK|nr:hypothetical protein [Massilia glaciei]PWF48827.1 hypothetical protein C7C56_009790 [Massilia glaciei]